jgi:hypothetical protein
VTTHDDREVSPRTRRTINGVLLLVVLAAGLLWFLAYLEASKMGPDRPQLFNDATTYLAAAERLNAGHQLYALTDGDRPILTIPGVYEAPLLSPPPIAAFWRVLIATPFGYPLWVAAAWLASIAAVAWVVLKAPLPAVPVALLLSYPLGEQVFGVNACAFYPLFYLLSWRYRTHAWIGGLFAIMAAIKLAPIAMVAWLVGTRRYRAMAVTFGALSLLFLIGGLGAGFDSYTAYLAMIPGVGPSPMSISGLTGVSWASYGAFSVGIVLAIWLGRRYPAGSFVVAVLTSVLGTPALYPGHLVSLLGVLAPLTDRPAAPTEPAIESRANNPSSRLLAQVRR